MTGGPGVRYTQTWMPSRSTQPPWLEVGDGLGDGAGAGADDVA